jgi:hypothetical protein
MATETDTLVPESQLRYNEHNSPQGDGNGLSISRIAAPELGHNEHIPREGTLKCNVYEVK